MRLVIAAGLAWMAAGCESAPDVVVDRASDNIQNFCLLSVQEDGGALAQVDPRTGAETLYPTGPMPHEVEVSPNSVFAYVSQFGMRDFDHDIGSPGDHVTEINLVTGATRVFTLPEGAGGPHGVRLRGGGTNELFANAEIGDRMVVFDANTGAVTRTFPIPANIHHFVFSLERDALFAFAFADGVYKLDAETGAVLARADLGSPARSVVLAHGGREVLAAARGEVVFLNASDLSIARRFPVSGVGQVIYATIDEAHGLVFAPAPGENVVVALDLETGAERARIELGRRPIIAVPGQDGAVYISNVEDTFITRVDLGDFSTTRVGSFERPNGLAIGACRAPA